VTPSAQTLLIVQGLVTIAALAAPKPWSTAAGVALVPVVILTTVALYRRGPAER
jgi:hypothetical protein